MLFYRLHSSSFLLAQRSLGQIHTGHPLPVSCQDMNTPPRRILVILNRSVIDCMKNRRLASLKKINSLAGTWIHLHDPSAEKYGKGSLLTSQQRSLQQAHYFLCCSAAGEIADPCGGKPTCVHASWQDVTTFQCSSLVEHIRMPCEHIARKHEGDMDQSYVGDTWVGVGILPCSFVDRGCSMGMGDHNALGSHRMEDGTSILEHVGNKESFFRYFGQIYSIIGQACGLDGPGKASVDMGFDRPPNESLGVSFACSLVPLEEVEGRPKCCCR